MKPRSQKEVENLVADIGDFLAKQDKEDTLTETDDSVQVDWEISDHMQHYWGEK